MTALYSGTVVNYACHPTTLAWENTLISPDYVGAMREVVEGETGAPCLFLQGASGDLGPREGYVGETTVADRNGRQLGFAALSGLEALPAPGTYFEYAGPVVSGAVLGTWKHRPLSEHGTRRGTPRGNHAGSSCLSPTASDLPTEETTRAELIRWEAEEATARAANDPERVSECRARAEQMTRQLARLASLPAGRAYPVPIRVTRLGGALWVFAAGELYQHFQVTLRDSFPQPCRGGCNAHQRLAARLPPGRVQLWLWDLSGNHCGRRAGWPGGPHAGCLRQAGASDQLGMTPLQPALTAPGEATVESVRIPALTVLIRLCYTQKSTVPFAAAPLSGVSAMWHRTAASLVLLLMAQLPASAQVNSVYSRAVPPDKAALQRLNLKIEWTAYVPVEGRRDTLTQVQTIDDQIFVQTRTGLLIAGDALTGRLQWIVQLGNGGYANSYPVAANSELVFVANVTQLHAFHRYTGVVEFVTDLGSPPTTGLAADDTGVYCVLGMRTGSGGAHRLTAFNLPRPIAIPDTPKGRPDPNKPPVKDPKAVNPIDNLMTRYAPEHMYRTNLPDQLYDARPGGGVHEAPTGAMTTSRSPSLSALPRMTPPYTLTNEVYSPSLNVLPSLRHPYRMRNDFQRDIQQSPSLGTIPPSMAAALRLSDLRPRNVQPPLRWEYGLTSRILYPAFLTPTRVWAITEGKLVVALNKVDKKVEVRESLFDAIAAPAAEAGVTAYVPISSGYLVSIDASSGNLQGGANIHWRTAVGGINNHIPFLTDKYVYASGDKSGVVCVERKDGNIIWRSDDQADRIIGATHEFIYIRDRQGKFLVYDARRPTDPSRKRSVPLSGIDLSEFNVNIVNTASDRIYLAADNGLIVCLRDMSAKYARPVRICPAASVNPPTAHGGGHSPNQGRRADERGRAQEGARTKAQGQRNVTTRAITVSPRASWSLCGAGGPSSRSSRAWHRD